MTSLPQTTNRISTIAKSMLGSIFEWYQFCIYGYFAPVIGKVFFPTSEGISHLLLAYGVFFAGYLARPVGGLIFSVIGDRYGRKYVLVWSLLLMAVSTTGIGLLPTYASIGYASPIMLIACRIIQGLSMGGNYGGSITYVFEHSTKSRRGFVSSFSVISVLTGLFLGSLTLLIFNQYASADFIESFGFRIPFLFGFGACIWAYVLHKTLPETPTFQNRSMTDVNLDNPVKDLFSNHLTSLLYLIGIVVLHDLSFYILFVFMTTYFTETLGLSKHLIFTINSFSLVLVAASVLISAWYSDQFGRVKVMKGAAICFIVATIPVFYLMTTPQIHWVLLLFMHAIFAIIVGLFLGPMPSLMVESFPSHIRNTGITTTGNICGPLFGGSAPFILTYLTNVTGISMIPAFYLTLSAVIAVFSLNRIILIEDKK